MTDLHYHHGESHKEEDDTTVLLLNQIIEKEKPDLVIFTGDILIAHQESDVTDGLKVLLQGVIQNKIPWAYVFGNHDHEKGVSKNHFLKAQQSLPNCLTINGPEALSGQGNFVLEIKDPETKEAGARLICLDSHDYPKNGPGKYAWVAKDQIDWFQEQMAKTKMPTYLFFHIPLPEYVQAWEAGQTIGSKHENVCCPEFNSGFFDALQKSEQVMACFVGHDHINDFCATYQGIDLNYGRMGGHHTYGKEGFLKGGRLIEITSQKWNYKTWCRLIDGSKVNEAIRDPKKTI